jgi:hypothetical protein
VLERQERQDDHRRADDGHESSASPPKTPTCSPRKHARGRPSTLHAARGGAHPARVSVQSCDRSVHRPARPRRGGERLFTPEAVVAGNEKRSAPESRAFRV